MRFSLKILIGVSHPKHVYIFKNVIACLINKGHEIRVVAVEKEMTTYLLRKFNIPYDVVGTNQSSLVKKAINLPKWEYNTLKIALDFKPDIYVGRALPHLAHVSALLRKPFIVFEDTEIAKLVHKITLPFANVVVTPYCYKDDLGDKQIRFNSFFELGYLHPKYFKSENSVLDELGLNKDEKFIILRIVSWGASHDMGHKGLDDNMISEFVTKLEMYGRVFISSEKKINEIFDNYKIDIEPDKLHSLLNCASLCISEGGTIAAEAAVLGTPSIYISPFGSVIGNFVELERAGVLHTFDNPKLALEDALDILGNENAKQTWVNKRRNMLKEKLDVNRFMVDVIEKIGNKN